jgi:hypothetical protein
MHLHLSPGGAPMRPYVHEFDPRLYSDSYLLSHVTEAQVQAAALDLLRAERIPALAVDAGGAKLRGAAYRALKGAGIGNAGAIVKGGAGASFAGLTDIIGTLPANGRALYLEIKAPQWTRLSKANCMRQARAAGKPTDDQLEFLDTMAAAGALVGVAWSPEDVADILKGARK